MRIIRNRQIVEDEWVHVGDEGPVPDGCDAIVTLKRFREEKDALKSRSGRLGLQVPGSTEAEDIAPYLPSLALVAIEFPAFTDGRGYSLARLLRDRYDFKGELRAVGDVLRDQLFYMHRCGFDAFELKAGKNIEAALGAFDDFSVTYQGASDDPRPLFRRR